MGGGREATVGTGGKGGRWEVRAAFGLWGLYDLRRFFRGGGLGSWDWWGRGAWFLDADGGGEGGFVACGARAVVAFCLLGVHCCEFFLRGAGEGGMGETGAGVEGRKGSFTDSGSKCIYEEGLGL